LGDIMGLAERRAIKDFQDRTKTAIELMEKSL